MNTQTMVWSDIPFVLAVCEAGSLSGAARKLGVNHSTVFRRIEGVERKLGVALFDRQSHGYVMTVEGEHFFNQALVLNEGVARIQRELAGQDLRLEGILTITTTDSLLYRLTPLFLAFQQKYPDVELQLLSGTRSLDLMQREADIALRPTRHPPDQWIGRSLLPIAYATYAHQEYLAHMQGKPGEQHRWIRLVDDLHQSPMNQITAQKKADGAPVTITSSLMGVYDLARSGLGIAALPCYLGENNPNLIRLHEPEAAFHSELWLLAHPGFRRNARVQAFFDFAAEKIQDDGTDFFKVTQ